ncbi:hypothetical protein H5410_056476 [Solanum commersonii]|uniref:Uncharacterized protein n=1 Tax=Solanum commersonii TaxID=4109 RepID=A0A9J5WN70_SOLCO|nr:hypothetical protein H5410_056476 [Solanum commersonii]
MGPSSTGLNALLATVTLQNTIDQRGSFGDLDFRHHFLLNFFVDVRQHLSYGVNWSRWANWPIFMSMDLLVIQISDIIFAKIFHGRSTRPLALESIGPDGKASPFSCSTIPGAVSFGHPDFRRHFCQHFSWKFVMTLDMELACLDR